MPASVVVTAAAAAAAANKRDGRQRISESSSCQVDRDRRNPHLTISLKRFLIAAIVKLQFSAAVKTATTDHGQSRSETRRAPQALSGSEWIIAQIEHLLRNVFVSLKIGDCFRTRNRTELSKNTSLEILTGLQDDRYSNRGLKIEIGGCRELNFSKGRESFPCVSRMRFLHTSVGILVRFSEASKVRGRG